MGFAGGPSCTGTSAMEGLSPDWATVKQVLQYGSNPGCNASDCHGVGSTNPLQMPLMDDAALFTNFTTIMSEDCGNIPIVTPGNSAQSAIVKILKEGCGKLGRMPKDCEMFNACLMPDYIWVIDCWVANGAVH
jgi:hypothetical protein